MKRTIKMNKEKWKQNGIFTIGGILIGAGLADCLFSLKHSDLNQLARGLTIFSAGLTILVVLDNSKTQKKTEKVQKETLLRIKKVEHYLDQMQQKQQTQQTIEKQLYEIKELLQKTNNK